MKNCVKSILFSAVLISVFAVSAHAAVIAVNAGHQAKANLEKEALGPSSDVMKYKVSGGTCGIATRIPEYELNLQNALRLKKELVKRGHRVIMIRERNDVNISNRERVLKALENGAELIINLHANAPAATQPKDTHGIMTLCRSSRNPFNAGLYGKEKKLALFIQSNLCKATGAKSIGVIEVDNMTGINWSTVPSVIVEVGYMTNADEDRRMADKSYQDRIACGIADGIEDYLSMR